jgi:hypothetical protein
MTVEAIQGEETPVAVIQEVLRIMVQVTPAQVIQEQATQVAAPETPGPGILALETLRATGQRVATQAREMPVQVTRERAIPAPLTLAATARIAAAPTHQQGILEVVLMLRRIRAVATAAQQPIVARGTRPAHKIST